MAEGPSLAARPVAQAPPHWRFRPNQRPEAAGPARRAPRGARQARPRSEPAPRGRRAGSHLSAARGSKPRRVRLQRRRERNVPGTRRPGGRAAGLVGSRQRPPTASGPACRGAFPPRGPRAAEPPTSEALEPAGPAVCGEGSREGLPLPHAALRQRADPRFRGRTGGALAPMPPVLLAARDSFAPRRRPRCVIPSCDPPAVSPRVPRPGSRPGRATPHAPPGGLSLGHATPCPGETRRAAPRGFHGRLCVLQPHHRRSLFFVTIDF